MTRVAISAVFADGYAPGDADEAVQVWNLGGQAADVGGWRVDDGEGTAAFPPGASVPPGDHVWLARDGAAFARSFGRPPDWAWSGAEGGVPRLITTGGGPKLANGGDDVALRDQTGETIDVLVYGTGPARRGWFGPAVQPYHPGAIAGPHQVLYRKLDPVSGQPLPDTDRATDWASDPDDPLYGRRPRFPGWDLEDHVLTTELRDSGRLEIAVAPDALFSFLARHFSSARASIDLMVYTFENPDLADILYRRARAGVRVRLLVDGSPAGGCDHNQRWCLARIAEAGGAVYWLDDGGDVRARFRGAHAKLAVIDGQVALVGSENPNLGATPSDDLADGTAGRRGAWLATDAPLVVAWASSLVARDIDPEHHADLRPFQARDTSRGAPQPDYVPDRVGGGEGYSPIALVPLATSGTFSFELVSAPENALGPETALLGLVGRAGDGDEVLVQQLSEPLWWGAGPSEGAVAINPRVAAYLSAARRGARVRVLLDGYFDDPDHWNGNSVTVAYLNLAARDEGLDLAAALGNPAGRGLHNKMVLVTLGRGGHASAGERDGGATATVEDLGPAERWVHLGSLNGSEVAHKVNREVAVQVASDSVTPTWRGCSIGTGHTLAPRTCGCREPRVERAGRV